MTTARWFPADLETALAHDDWRSHVMWPVGMAESNRVAAAQIGRALRWADKLDDRLLQGAVLLSLPNILGYGRAIVLAAMAVSRAAARGFELRAVDPEIAYLANGQGKPLGGTELIMPPARTSLKNLRRLARIGTWSSPAQFIRAVARPDAVAVSHNPLLIHAATQERRALGFWHAESILDFACRHHGTGVSAVDLTKPLARVLLGNDVDEEPYRQRSIDLLQATVRSNLERATRDMDGLRGVSLPAEVWTGSGGTYAARAVGLEVLRRGGRVVRFDHGTPRGFVKTPEFAEMLELAVSTSFVMSTVAAAEICRNGIGALLLKSRLQCQVRGLDGDPVFAKFPLRRTRERKGRKPRVVYAPTMLMGFRHGVPVQPPDVVYLDWQMRVAEALNQLPIDFVCQPHPEGLLRDRAHPVERVARTVRGNFTAQLQSADVFVFDYPTTTTLWESVCTDARIVYLNIGAGTMSPEIEELFANRATVITVAEDSYNRPTLDASVLRDAVLAESCPGDPMPFRRLLAGDQ